MSSKKQNKLVRYLSVGSPTWAIRRRIVIGTLLFCAGLTIWAAGWMELERAKAVISQCFTLATMVIGYYVFGPIADDYLTKKAQSAEPAPAPPTPPKTIAQPRPSGHGAD